MSTALGIAAMITAVLQAMPWIPAAAKAGISKIGALMGLIFKYSSAPAVAVTSIVLAVIQATISDLKVIPNLSAEQLSEIVVLEDALAAGVAANGPAGQKVDPGTLLPITPVP